MRLHSLKNPWTIVTTEVTDNTLHAFTGMYNPLNRSSCYNALDIAVALLLLLSVQNLEKIYVLVFNNMLHHGASRNFKLVS